MENCNGIRSLLQCIKELETVSTSARKHVQGLETISARS